MHLLVGAVLSAAFAVVWGIMLLSAGGERSGAYFGPRDTIAFSTDALIPGGGGAPGIYLISGVDARRVGMDNFWTRARLIAVQSGADPSFIYSLTWTPDGSLLLYLVARYEGAYPYYQEHADLWTIGADGRSPHLLTRDFVSWKTARQYPLFTLISADAGLDALVRKTVSPRDERAPARAPDGRTIAVRETGIDSHFICMRDVSAPTPIPELDHCFADSIRTSYPAWSPR